jgi:TfoX/Sxy family transcriptional regulator of competence genes
MSAALGKPMKGCPSGMSGHRLVGVDPHAQWRILVMTSMTDDEAGEPGVLSYDPAAAERVRQLLSGRNDVVEKKMVGGLSFLVNGNMCCGITGTALMVRVGAESREQALREPHARPMLFAGRALSGFICIEPDGYATDDALASWVQRGLDLVSGLPAKPVRASS